MSPKSNRQRVLYPLFLASLWAFVLAAAAGVAFRWETVASLPVGLAISDIRHGHSHLMLMGWATPALMVCMARRWPGEGGRRTDSAVAVTGWASWGLALASFPAFLFFGYDSVAIGSVELPVAAVLSGLAIFAWYAFAVIYFIATRGVRRTAAMRVWDLAVATLVVSSFGAWGVAGVMAVGIDDPLWQMGTVHFFVDLFGAGWLGLGVLGLLRSHLDAPDSLQERVGRLLVALGVGPLFLVGIPRSLLSAPWIVVGSASAALVAVGLVLLVTRFYGHVDSWLRFVFLFVSFQLLMLAGAVFPPLAEWGLSTGFRILYLHVTLAGFATLGLVVTAVELWSPRAVGSRWLWASAIAALLAPLAFLTGLWPASLGGSWTMTAAFVGALVAFALTLFAAIRATGFLLGKRGLALALMSVSGLVFCTVFTACDAPESTGASTHEVERTGPGPSGVDHGAIDEIGDDPDLVERGDTLFHTEGCLTCHGGGQHGSGPALRGVTQRRHPAWLARVIMHPAQMREHDSTARRLSENYSTVMPETNLDPDETRAIIAYLATVDSSGPTESTDE